MPVTQQGFIPSSVNVTIAAAQNSKITNLTLVSANTEYSHALTANLKQVIIRARGLASLKVSFVINESGIKYFTIPLGNSLSLSDLNFSGQTVYLQSGDASTIVEILELY